MPQLPFAGARVPRVRIKATTFKKTAIAPTSASLSVEASGAG